MDKETFGTKINDILYNSGRTLRTFFKELEKNGYPYGICRVSRILRGLHNPSNKDEFDFFIKASGIIDPNLIKELEQLAMEFIPKKILTEEEFAAQLPIFIPGDADHNKIIDYFKKELDKDQNNFDD